MNSMMRRTAFFGAVTAGLVSILASSWPSQASPHLDGGRFSYAAPVTCGFDPDGAFARIVPGQYATTVNVYNPSRRPVLISRRLSLTFPDAQGGAGPEAGLVSPALVSKLEAGAALQVDCGEIPAEFFGDLPLPPYIQGFLVLEASSPLDVAAVTTVAMVDAMGGMEAQSIDVQLIPGRRR